MYFIEKKAKQNLNYVPFGGLFRWITKPIIPKGISSQNAFSKFFGGENKWVRAIGRWNDRWISETNNYFSVKTFNSCTFIFSGWFTSVKFKPQANPSIPILWMNSHIPCVKWRKDAIGVDAVTISVTCKYLWMKMAIFLSFTPLDSLLFGKKEAIGNRTDSEKFYSTQETSTAAWDKGNINLKKLTSLWNSNRFPSKLNEIM